MKMGNLDLLKCSDSTVVALKVREVGLGPVDCDQSLDPGPAG